MSIGVVLNTAKLALAAQQTGLTVTGHNIANVNSPHYSRQTVQYSSTDPLNRGGLWIGTGVEVNAIQRSYDKYLENRLIEIRSELAGSEETSSYMDIMESAFNENSESSISHVMNEFWNTWHDVSNNPTGSPERIATYEKGVYLAERFDTITNDILQIETDLNGEISAIIGEVNSISSQIAYINNRILEQSSGNIVHDLSDTRNALVAELSEQLNIKTFEQPDGALLVTTPGGFNLVTGADSYPLQFSRERVLGGAPVGGQIDITDRITGGKIKGWLEMRDEIIAKYKAELDALAKEFIWTVNYQHSQGIGQKYFDSAVTGTYATDSTGMLNTLAYSHKIDYSENFKMWIEDTSGASPTYTSVTVDMHLSDANPTYAGGDTFNQANTAYTLRITSGGTANVDNITFDWSESGGGSGTVTMVAGMTTVNIDGMDISFTAGDAMVAGNTLRINTDAAGDDAGVSLTPTGTANSILDSYQFTVTSGGVVGTDTITVDWSNSVTTGSFFLDASTTTVTVDGMSLAFAAGGRFAADDVFTVTTDSSGSPAAGMMSDWHWTLDSFVSQFNTDATAAGVSVTAFNTSGNKLTFTPGANEGFAFSDDSFSDSGIAAVLGINTFFTGQDAQTMAVNSVLAENDYIAAATLDGTTGAFGVGDSSNAIAISDLKYSSRNMAIWTYSRGDDAVSSLTTYTLEDYHQAMVASIGIKSAALDRSVAFNESMANKLTEQRDNLSAVSLDEEMINLMKFQQAFTMASKLLTVADEMLTTLINSKG